MKRINSTVIVPAPDFNLTTLAAAKLEFDIQTDDQDVYIESQILRASDDIANYCRRVFALQRYTDTFGGGGPWGYWKYREGSYFLAHRPVVPGSVNIVSNGSVVGVNDWSIDYETGIIDIMTWTALTAEITYDAGWFLPGWEPGSTVLTGPPLPPSIGFAAIQMINANRQAGRMQFDSAAASGVRSETVEGVGTITYGSPSSSSATGAGSAGAMPTSVVTRLAPFVIPVFPPAG